MNAIEGLVKIYPEGGHAIRDTATNTVHPEYLDDLVEFIHTSTEGLASESGVGESDEPQT